MSLDELVLRILLDHPGGLPFEEVLAAVLGAGYVYDRDLSELLRATMGRLVVTPRDAEAFLLNCRPPPSSKAANHH